MSTLSLSAAFVVAGNLSFHLFRCLGAKSALVSILGTVSAPCQTSHRVLELVYSFRGS